MSMLEDILFAEPTFVGMFGAGIVHMAIWIVLGSWEFGGVKIFWDYIKDRHPDLYHNTLHENYKKEVGVAVFGLEDDPASMWISNWFTTLHHGTAGLLMFIGMYSNMPWVWRHGLLIQLFGMDIADVIRIIWCKLVPDGGPFPHNRACKVNGYIAFIMFHHSVSLFAGVPTSIYFSEEPQFQWLGALLAGGPLICVGWDIIAKSVPAKKWWFHMMSELYMNSVFCYQRLYLFFPLAWSLLSIVYRADVPDWAKISLFMGGASMSLFNLMCCCMMVCGWVYKHLGGGNKDDDASSASPAPADKLDSSVCNADDLPTILTSKSSIVAHDSACRSDVKHDDVRFRKTAH